MFKKNLTLEPWTQGPSRCVCQLPPGVHLPHPTTHTPEAHTHFSSALLNLQYFANSAPYSCNTFQVNFYLIPLFLTSCVSQICFIIARPSQSESLGENLTIQILPPTWCLYSSKNRKKWPQKMLTRNREREFKFLSQHYFTGQIS